MTAFKQSVKVLRPRSTDDGRRTTPSTTRIVLDVFTIDLGFRGGDGGTFSQQHPPQCQPTHRLHGKSISKLTLFCRIRCKTSTESIKRSVDQSASSASTAIVSRA